jgi:tRNA-binding EMAP/Myf-like protein
MDTNFRNSLNGVNPHFKNTIALAEVQDVIGKVKQGRKQLPTIFAGDIMPVDKDLNKQSKGENAKNKHKQQAGSKEEKKTEASKKQVAPQKETKAAAAGPTNEEALEIFSKCDLRVGKIVECEKHPDSDKLWIEKIDLGEGSLRTIGSGLQ